MEPMYYIGLDVHKRKISYCVKDGSGKVFAEGSLSATRLDLDHWMGSLPQPWSAAMEATMFTGWIYDHLMPHAAALKVAHPLMLRAIATAKKKNDRIDASKICDCLRCDFLPECYMASTAIRERRRTDGHIDSRSPRFAQSPDVRRTRLAHSASETARSTDGLWLCRLLDTIEQSQRPEREISDWIEHQRGYLQQREMQPPIWLSLESQSPTQAQQQRKSGTEAFLRLQKRPKSILE